MKDGKPVAFLSRRFVPDKVVDAICKILTPDIVCQPATDLKLVPIPQEILERIKQSDLLIAIITKEGNSFWIQNELGMAFALDKPILVFCEDGVSIGGFAPMVSEYVSFKRHNLAEVVNDKERLVTGIQGAVAKNRKQRQELTAFAEQRNLGVVGVYPDRKDAFLHFRDPWNSEQDRIHIVASTLEGFRKFVGDAGHELLETKLKQGCRVDVLLTHPDFLKFRAENENVQESWIRDQLQQTIDQLKTLNNVAPGRLEVRCFAAAPTCFTVITSDHMLVNPYPYMRTAYSCFALVVQKTAKSDDVYHIYNDYHFQRAWDHAEKIALTPRRSAKKGTSSTNVYNVPHKARKRTSRTR
jgi:nucleoside 2-deoxyribosyltransferase